MSRRGLAFIRLTVLLSAVLGITACDCFEPLLAPNGCASQQTSNLLSVTVERIPERIGQKLRQFLIERLTPQPVTCPVYTLKVQLTNTPQQLGIQKDATTVRMRHVLKACYQLIEKSTGKVCHQQTLTTYASYYFVDEQFYSNTVSQQASQQRALRTMADLIRLDLAVFLQQHKRP